MTTQVESQCRRPGKRWLLWAGLLVCLLLIGSGMVITWVSRPGPMERGFNRIHRGMTIEEVEHIFGQPSEERLYSLVHLWGGDDGQVVVGFNPDHGVRASYFVPTEQPSYFQRVRIRIRSWLGMKPPEVLTGVPWD
jgi:hypothetical protein